MSKYIDAEKLREEIKFAKSVYSNPQRVVHGIADAFRQDGRAAMCDDILKKLDSLQQDKDVLNLCSQVWWEDRGWIMIPPNATLKGIESLLERVRHKIKWNEENRIEEQERSKSICSRGVHRNKIDDSCEYPYGGRKCRINENGVYECNGFEEVEQLEYPEVDLDNEMSRFIRTYFNKPDYDKDFIAEVDWEKSMKECASHFYELGLNRRKNKI